MIDGRPTVSFCGSARGSAWSRYRIAILLRDRTIPSVFAALDALPGLRRHRQRSVARVTRRVLARMQEVERARLHPVPARILTGAQHIPELSGPTVRRRLDRHERGPGGACPPVLAMSEPDVSAADDGHLGQLQSVVAVVSRRRPT